MMRRRSTITATSTRFSTSISTVDTSTRTVSLEADETDEAITNLPRRRSSCYSQILMDWTGTLPSAPSVPSHDGLHKTDGSAQSKAIDIPSSFSPPIGINMTNKKAASLAKAGVVFWKFSVLALQLAAFTGAFLMDPKAFWFAYLTNWALLFSMIYSALSFANTIFPISTTSATTTSSSSSSSVDDSKDVNSSESSALSARAAVTSSFFTAAGVTQMAVTLLYWILVHSTGLFDGVLLAYRIVLHGGVCFLVLVDGLVVNRIPVRLYHWLGICFFPSFIIWTVLQSPLGFDLDNPYAEDLGVDDDKIYPFLDWELQPMSTLALSLVCVLVVYPILHFILWALSLAGRKYVNVHNDDGTNVNEPNEDSEIGESKISAV